MMRLLKVEMGRLMSRRLFRVAAVAGLIAVLAVDGLIAAKSDKNVAAAEKRATVVLQAEYQNCLAHAVKEGSSGGPTKQDCDRELPANRLKDCLAIAASHQQNGPTAADCRREGTVNEFYNDPRFHFADHARDLITGAAFIFMAIGLVLAASSVGAEWQSGTFASLLTWEPRRQRVLAAKLVAPVLGLLALAIPLMLLLEGGGWLAADLRGTTQGADTHLFWQIASQYGRVVGLLALVALIGAALAAVTRHTVAVLALVGGYLIAGEIVAGIASAWWRNHGLFAHRSRSSAATMTTSPTQGRSAA